MNLSFSVCLLAYHTDFTTLILFDELLEKCMLPFASDLFFSFFFYLKTRGLQHIKLQFLFCFFLLVWRLVFHIKVNTFETKENKVRRGWRKIREDELNYFSLYNVLLR
jgi:hypothetical protein